MILNTAFLNYSKCLKQKLMINCKAFIAASACWIATKVIVKPCLYILNNNMEKEVKNDTLNNNMEKEVNNGLMNCWRYQSE